MDKRILIIGGFGFLGRNLYLYLKKAGYKTINIFSNVPLTLDDPFRKTFTHSLFSGSINNKQIIEEVIESHDVLFSFAGLSGAAGSISNPYADIHTNLEGHLNILEACRKKKSKTTVIFPSSRLVYGKPQLLPVDENHYLAPQSIYAIHKNTTEYYHLLYSRLYNINTVIFRISNPYGFSHNPQGINYSILNKFVHKAISQEIIEIFGDGRQVRDYIYIDDLSKIMEIAIQKEDMSGNIYNIGSGEGISIIETIQIIKEFIPELKYKLIEWPKLEKTIETGDYVSDISKIKYVTNWTPEIDIKSGLRMTIDAYRK